MLNKHWIKVSHRTTAKMRSALVRPKHRRPLMNRNGIFYKISMSKMHKGVLWADLLTTSNTSAKIFPSRQTMHTLNPGHRFDFNNEKILCAALPKNNEEISVAWNATDDCLNMHVKLHPTYEALRDFRTRRRPIEIVYIRQFNEASRGISNSSRFRTNSDSCPSPYHTGPYIGSCAASGNLYGPGCTFASVVAAASNSRSVSPHYCRECGQVLPTPSSVNKQASSGGPVSILSPRVIASGSHQIAASQPFPSTPQAPTSPSAGLTPNGRFAIPTNRAPTLPISGSSFVGDKFDQFSKNASEDEEEDRCATPPLSSYNISAS